MKKINLLFIVIIYGLVCIPTLIYPLVKKYMDLNNYENRELMKYEDVKKSNIVDIPSNFDSFINDNLAFKNELQKMRSRIKYNLFKTPNTEKVVIGKDGYLFFNSGTDKVTDSIGDYNGLASFTNDEINQIEDNLIKVNDKLNKDKVNFYLLVAPNKSSIYSNMMPEAYKIVNESRMDRLIKTLKEDTKINVVYPKELLLANKDKYRLYYKGDTHWNIIGATLGVQSYINASSDKKYSINQLKIVDDYDVKHDLNSLNMYFDNIPSSELKIDYNEVCDGKIDGVYYCKNKNAVIKKKIMLVGDSFRLSMIKPLSYYYSEVIIVYLPSFNHQLIQKYKPKDIIYEVVERNSYQLYKGWAMPCIKDSFTN